MKDKQIFIDFKSSNYNLVVKTKDISKVSLITPLTANLATNLVEENENVLLNIEDRIVRYNLVDKLVSYHFYSPNLLSKTVKIIIPEDMVVNLNVNLENSSIFLKDIIFDNMNLSTLRGNISIKNSNGGISSISGYTSDILLHNLSGTKCIACTKTGEIIVENNIPYNTELKTDIGNINLKVPDDFLRNTEITLECKNISKRKLLFKQNNSKKLVLSAPNGKITSNIF